MAAVSPILKPLGVAAAALASFEALVWGILALLGLLACQEVYDTSTYCLPFSFNWDSTTLNESSHITFSDCPRLHIYSYLVVKKDTTLPFMGLYIGSSVVWIIVSSMLLYDFLKSKFTFYIVIAWTSVTFAVCILDLVATIMFGLEFSKRMDMLDDTASKYSGNFAAALPPLLIMILSARGFVLWLINMAAAVYLSIAAYQLNTHINCDKGMQSAAVKRISDAASLYGSTAGERDNYSRANPLYQPEPLSAWNVQSPTVGDKKRGPWNFPDTTSPAKIFPRVGRPVSTPVAPVSPLPTPQPDYSPPLSRPVRHEPYMYETPLRSALKKPTQFGRTIL